MGDIIKILTQSSFQKTLLHSLDIFVIMKTAQRFEDFFPVHYISL